MISKKTIKYFGGGIRLDQYLTNNQIVPSRSKAQKLIKSNNILLNDVAVKSSHILKNGDVISIQFETISPLNTRVKDKKYVLDIIFEDENVIVLNKPFGLSVHPSETTNEYTLCDYLLDYYPPMSEAVMDYTNKTALIRPGIVHRLDKDTSGVMVVAKNLKSLRYLSDLFKSRSVKKEYFAVCYGWPSNQQGVLSNYLGRKKSDRKVFTEVGLSSGKYALSKYYVEQCFAKFHIGNYSLVKFIIYTGRTHQIRAQSLLMNHPVIGDKYYYTNQSKLLSKRLLVNRQLLHSFSLAIKLPDNDYTSVFKSTLPQDMECLLSDNG